MSYFKIGDIVEATCADWIWDNPMIVTAEDHVCTCGCNNKGMITCRGTSGARYEECVEAFKKPYDPYLYCFAKDFEFNGNKYHIKTPLFWHVEPQKNYTLASNKELDSLVGNPDRTKIDCSIEEDLDFLFRNYVEDDYGNLSSKASSLKNKLLEVMEKI